MFGKDYHELNRMIKTLESYLPEDLTYSFSHRGNNARSDWKRFWDYAKEIQALFKSGIRFPAKEDQQKAWEKFNGLRNEAQRRSLIEKSHIENSSKNIRNSIFSMCNGIKYIPINDLVFFFDKTTVEQVKSWQVYLKTVQTELSNNKHNMTGEHRQECWELIQDIKESHQLFWNQHKKNLEVKNKEFELKKQGYREKIYSNLSRNKEKLSKANAALYNQNQRLNDLRDKYYGARSDKWKEIFSDKVSECVNRIRDIESSINKISKWIDEDEIKLMNL